MGKEHESKKNMGEILSNGKSRNYFVHQIYLYDETEKKFIDLSVAMRKKDAFEEQFSGDFISFHSFLGFRFGKNVKMTINSLENVIRIHKLN